MQAISARWSAIQNRIAQDAEDQRVRWYHILGGIVAAAALYFGVALSVVVSK